MPYSSMHMPIGWNGLSMPTEGCSVHIPIGIINLKLHMIKLKIDNNNEHVHRTPISGHAQSIPTNRHVHRTIGHTGHAQTSLIPS